MLDRLHEAIAAGQPAALATVIESRDAGIRAGVTMFVSRTGESYGSTGFGDLDRVIVRDARSQIDVAIPIVRHYGVHGEPGLTDISVFIEPYAPAPRMLIFGAVDFSAALCAQAVLLGYQVTVCDARRAFANSERFPLAHDIVIGWPDAVFGALSRALTRSDAVCVLTHDSKFDIPALSLALRSEAGYIGAMGNRRTHALRSKALEQAGLGPETIARVRSPIGLDLGAATPEETAVSILAEIIALRSGRSGVPLSATTGPIHGQMRGIDGST